LIWARVADGDGGGGTLAPRAWLAYTAPAGFARPPIPRRGLGRGLSIVVGSLTPPASSARGTARHEARHERPAPTVPIGGLARLHHLSTVDRRHAGALIDWFGEGRATDRRGDGHSIDWFGERRVGRAVGGGR
jgi:hypothetical protein